MKRGGIYIHRSGSHLVKCIEVSGLMFNGERLTGSTIGFPWLESGADVWMFVENYKELSIEINII